MYYIKKKNLNIKVNIFSPEFDSNLIKSLSLFQYPEEFQEFQNIINILSSQGNYKDENISIELFNGDARDYIKQLKDIDIVYQDAFSSDVNPALWTVEYFKDISQILSSDAIITTYSISTPIRLSIYENNFLIYEYKPNESNRITIALNKKDIDINYKYIDMELKKQRSTNAITLHD